MSYDINSDANEIMEDIVTEYVDEDYQIESTLLVGEVLSLFYDSQDGEALDEVYSKIDAMDEDLEAMGVSEEEVPEVQDEFKKVAEEASKGNIPSGLSYPNQYTE